MWPFSQLLFLSFHTSLFLTICCKVSWWCDLVQVMPFNYEKFPWITLLVISYSPCSLFFLFGTPFLNETDHCWSVWVSDFLFLLFSICLLLFFLKSFPNLSFNHSAELLIYTIIHLISKSSFLFFDHLFFLIASYSCFRGAVTSLICPFPRTIMIILLLLFSFLFPLCFL